MNVSAPLCSRTTTRPAYVEELTSLTLLTPSGIESTNASTPL
ncbi:hypothetical protein [Nocardioides flavescens]|nr:hypothetical protein [Nocardioides flavescens]